MGNVAEKLGRMKREEGGGETGGFQWRRVERKRLQHRPRSQP